MIEIQDNFKAKFCKRVFFFTALIILLCASVFSVKAQDNASQNSNTKQSAESPTPEVSTTPIPTGEVVTQAEETTGRLEKISEGLKENPGITLIETELPELKSELDSRIPETSRLLSSGPSLESLRTIEQDWQDFAKDPTAWKETLKAQITIYDNFINELKGLKEIWQNTLKSLTGQPDNTAVNSNSQTNSNTAFSNPNINQIPVTEIPEEVLQKIRSELDEIEKTQKQVEDKRGHLLTLQTRVVNEETRINEMLNSIKNIREKTLTNLFVKDSPAIWNIHKNTESVSSLSVGTANSLSGQINSLTEYFNRQTDKFILHGLTFSLFAIVLLWLKRRLVAWSEKEPELERAFTVFKFPILSALILAVLVNSWFYPQAPRMLLAILGALALIPGIIFLRQILERPFYSILNVLVILYFIDQLRAVTATLPIISRVLFLCEILGASVFLIWFFRSKKLSDKIPVSHHKIFNVIRRAIPVILLFFGGAFIANIFGYISLSNVIGRGTLASAYIALVFYVAVQIIESLLRFAFRVPPLTSLRMVREHRQLLERKAFTIIKWVAVIIWGILTLRNFSVRDKIFESAANFITAQLEVGSFAVSLSDILIFLFTVWLAFTISKVVRFILDEDVYPHITLAEGVPYAISTILHYTLLVGGFLIAIAAMGIDMTKFTILAGALGVGLGFGLQNIVNNFVSGLILLFERPVKVGDFIKVKENQGDLKKIGLRASLLRTVDGSEVVVPNGQLISEDVTNWTFTDRQRRIEVNVGVAYGSKPRQVIEMITKIALENEDVLKDPPPRTMFMNLGDSSLDFQLRAWTGNTDNWVSVRSDLILVIYETLEKAGIEIPFPQRDLNIRKVDDNLLKELNKDT